MIVSDSTTLIVLMDLKREDLLFNLFKKVYLPKAVYEELCFKNEIELADFFEVLEVRNKNKVKELELLLDKGESEAITLALEKTLPLIIDEKKGRKIAQNLGIKIVGLLGILYLNIKQGYISKEEALNFLELAIQEGFRVDKTLIDKVFGSL